MKKNNYLKTQLGSTLNVIIEKKSSTQGYHTAISNNYIKLMVRGDKITPGDKLDVDVISLTGSNLIAQAPD